MPEAAAFLRDFTLVLGVAAVSAVLCRLTRQPVVVGYLLAGVLLGPHVPIVTLVEPERVRSLAELGVILVMFSVGLEFSLRRLWEVLPTAGVAGVVQVSCMVFLGHSAAQVLGWSLTESIFAGAIVAFSSTMMVSRTLAEEGIRGPLAELVLGILLVEDLAAVLLLALLTTVASGASLGGAALVGTAGRLAIFLAALVGGGFLVVPRLFRAIAHLGSAETLLVAAVALCFGVALMARFAGYSVALGAFLAGTLIAEAGERERVEPLVRPLREIFAAIFFVAVGMLVDPAVVRDEWPSIGVLMVTVVVGQLTSVSFGAFVSGHDVRTAVRAGLCLAQVGEFAFVIAGVGVSAGAVGSRVFPVTVTVAILTMLLTPALVRASSAIASRVDRSLPRPLQTFAALYGSWVRQLRARSPGRARRLVRVLVTDAVVLAALAIGAAIATRVLPGRWALAPGLMRTLILVGAAACALPFLIGVVRAARVLGAILGAGALPEAAAGQLDLAAAPRRMFVVALQLGIVLVVGIPLVALTQPFLPPLYGATVLFLALGALGVSFFRRAGDLHAHVRAGAEMVIEALVRQAGQGRETPSLAQVRPLLPGLGALTPVALAAGSPAIGRTLASLDLRGRTGATVLAITRGQEGVVVPTGRETLLAGDILALAGTEEAVAAASQLLCAADRFASPLSRGG